jgi:predicted Fe-S protein YdhL (DUF1289 family)
MNIPSPCTGVCQLNSDEICVGCFRLCAEIARWTQMSDYEKCSVITALNGRREFFTTTSHEPVSVS